MNGNLDLIQQVDISIGKITSLDQFAKQELRRLLQIYRLDNNMQLALKMALKINQLEIFLENLAKLNRAELVKFLIDYIGACCSKYPAVCYPLLEDHRKLQVNGKRTAEEARLPSSTQQPPEKVPRNVTINIQPPPPPSSSNTNPSSTSSVATKPTSPSAQTPPAIADDIMTPLQKMQFLCQQYAALQLKSKNALHRIVTDVMKWFHDTGLKTENQKLNILLQQPDSPHRRDFNEVILCPRYLPQDKVIEVFWSKIIVLCHFKSIGATILQENYEKMKMKDGQIDNLNHSQFAQSIQDKESLKAKLNDVKQSCQNAYVFAKFIFHDLIPEFEKDPAKAKADLNHQINVDRLRELQRLTHQVKKYALQNLKHLDTLDSFEAQLFEQNQAQTQIKTAEQAAQQTTRQQPQRSVQTNSAASSSKMSTPTPPVNTSHSLHQGKTTTPVVQQQSPDRQMLDTLIKQAPNLLHMENNNPSIRQILASARAALEYIKKDIHFTNPSTYNVYLTNLEMLRQAYAIAQQISSIREQQQQQQALSSASSSIQHEIPKTSHHANGNTAAGTNGDVIVVDDDDIIDLNADYD